MLNKKDKKVADDKNNGQGEVLALLNAIAGKQQEQDERLTELEDGKAKDTAQLRLVNLVYDTDEEHLPGLTRLPLMAVKPFAVGMMLDAILDEDVRSGKRSLPSVFRRNYFHLMRSVGAEAFNKANELAAQQASEEAEKGIEHNI
jgi:hypothetical protein